MVDLSLNQKNLIITRSKDKISDIKKIFTNKGAQIFDFPAISFLIFSSEVDVT